MRRRSQSPAQRSWTWRHELPPQHAPSPYDVDDPIHQAWLDLETGIDAGWRNLALTHSSFRRTEQEEYRELVDGLRDIERIFFEHPELAAYYDECQRPPEPGRPTQPPLTDAPIRHVVAIQAQFMEDVYFVLQLARFPNALDNRGWMNLFRGWGASPTFNAFLDRLRHTFTAEFIDFYDTYLSCYPGTIEEHPVPHPWDPWRARADPRIPIADALRRREDAALRGAFLDSGRQEAGTSGTGGRSSLPSPGSGSRGVKDETGTVSNPMEQSQPGGERKGPTKPAPPNA